MHHGQNRRREILGQIVRIHSLLDSNRKTGIVLPTSLQYCTILLLTLPCLMLHFDTFCYATVFILSYRRYRMLLLCPALLSHTVRYCVSLASYGTIVSLASYGTMTSNLNKLSKST